jgi:hypothetical protein
VVWASFIRTIGWPLCGTWITTAATFLAGFGCLWSGLVAGIVDTKTTTQNEILRLASLHL